MIHPSILRCTLVLTLLLTAGCSRSPDAGGVGGAVGSVADVSLGRGTRRRAGRAGGQGGLGEARRSPTNGPPSCCWPGSAAPRGRPGIPLARRSRWSTCPSSPRPLRATTLRSTTPTAVPSAVPRRIIVWPRRRIVEVVDAKGQVPAVDARKLLGLAEGQTVVVRGEARIDGLGNLAVRARGVHLRRQTPEGT